MRLHPWVLVPMLALSGCPLIAGVDNDYTASEAGGVGPSSGDSAGSDGRARTDGGKTGHDAHAPKDAAREDRTASDGPAPSEASSFDHATPDDVATADRNVPVDSGAPPCGGDCAGTCENGECLVTLATQQGESGTILLSGPTLYWASYGNGTVASVPTAGGAVTTLASDYSSAFGLTIAGAAVVWSCVAPSGPIVEVPIIGGTPSTVVVPSEAPFFLASNESSVFATLQTDNDMGVVIQVDLEGGGVTTLASGQDGTSGIATDGANVYFSDVFGGDIVSVPIGGGALTTLATGQAAPYMLVESGGVLYWTNQEVPGSVVSIPTSGGSPNTLASGQGEPNGLAVDGTNVYWADLYSGSVVKVPVGGGTPTTIATNQAPEFVAVDATSVYWTTNSGSMALIKATPK